MTQSGNMRSIPTIGKGCYSGVAVMLSTFNFLMSEAAQAGKKIDVLTACFVFHNVAKC